MDGMEIRARRKALKLTQAAFASRLGISRDYVGQLERGAAELSPTIEGAIRGLRPEAASRTLTVQDPMEQIIERALIDAGIDYRTDQDGGTDTALDFYLPAYDVSIEVKRFYTARTGDQMARALNVIVAQGETAVRFLAAAIRSGDFFPIVDMEKIDNRRRQVEAVGL